MLQIPPIPSLRRYWTVFVEHTTGNISSGHLFVGSFGELRDMVGLIQDRMVVMAEHQRPDTGLSGSPVVNKPGTVAAGAALRVGVLESRRMFRGIVKDVIPQAQYLPLLQKGGLPVSVGSTGSWVNGSQEEGTIQTAGSLDSGQ